MTQTTSATTTSSEGMTTSSTHRSATSSGVSASTPSVQQSTLTTSTSSWLSASTPSNLYLVMVEGIIAISGTAEASYNDVIRRESYNANGETTEENNDFLDDIDKRRLLWCDGSKNRHTKRGCQIQLRNSVGSSLHQERMQATEAAATQQRQLWWL